MGLWGGCHFTNKNVYGIFKYLVKIIILLISKEKLMKSTFFMKHY